MTTVVLPAPAVAASVAAPAMVRAAIAQAAPVQALLSSPMHIATMVQPPATVQASIAVGQGPAGQSAGQASYTAAQAIGGHRAVYVASDGLRLVDADDPVASASALGVSGNAAAAGGAVLVQTGGRLDEASWAWVVPLTIYCGSAGALTQTPPEHGAIIEMGFALSPTAMHVRVREPDYLEEL